jgi:hypothetical protein
VYRPLRHHLEVGRFGLPALFTLITCALAAIALDSAGAGRWPIAVAAAVLAAWMGSFALAALRKTRR